MRQPKLIGSAIAILGVIIALMAFIIDLLGFGDPDVFGTYQLVSLILGIVLILLGIILWLRPPQSTDHLRDLAARSYKTFAYLFLNTVILFILLNALIGIYLVLTEDQPTPQEESQYPWVLYRQYFAQTYPNHTPEEVEALLKETWYWGGGLECEPFTHYRDKPQSGEYVNIDQNGFRHIANQSAWPPNPDDYVVFVFGGSSALGYGLSDAETIPSYLQAHLRDQGINASIYNFGRGNYFSTQEVILLQSLIREGNIPDAVVFVEGLNDFKRRTGYPRGLSLCTEEGTTVTTQPAKGLTIDLPMLTLAENLKAQSAPIQTDDGEPGIEPETPEETESTNSAIIRRWLANMRFAQSTAEAYDLDIVIVLQPVPTYLYDEAYHPYVTPDSLHYNWVKVRLPQGYEALREMQQTGDPQMPPILDLSTIQQDRHEMLYVDLVHYTAAFSEEIATHISEELLTVMDTP